MSVMVEQTWSTIYETFQKLPIGSNLPRPKRKREEDCSVLEDTMTTRNGEYPDPSVSPIRIEPFRASRKPKTRLVIVMVGLPARGKSYVTNKLCRYLNWLHYDTKIFNVGNRRRKLNEDYPNEASTDHSATFFDPNNEKASKLREVAAMSTLDELLDYLLIEGGKVGLFDATNSTRARRKLIVDRVHERAGEDIEILFVESQCFDEKLLLANMRLKLSGPDYLNHDPTTALADFRGRISMYQQKYNPLGPEEERLGWSYCQMIDVGRKFIMCNIQGFLPNQTVQYLQHFHLRPRQIWLTRHGQSVDDVAGRLGGDSDLTQNGMTYAAALTRFITYRQALWNKSRSKGEPVSELQSPCESNTVVAVPQVVPQELEIWTSNMLRSKHTATPFRDHGYYVRHLRMLDELNAGMLEGFTREETKELYSDWFERRQNDKVHYRYPGSSGEGYLDVTNRLKSVILEVERMQDHLLMISGLAVTRVLLAYFRGLKKEEVANLHVPLGTLFLLEPEPYGVSFKEFNWNPDTDWFEEKTL